MSDVLEQKAEEAVTADQLRKDINNLGKRLKDKYPDKNIKPWMKQYVFASVYQKMFDQDIAKMLGMSRTTIWKYVDQDIKDFIEDLRNEQLFHYEHRLYNLIEKSITALEEIVDEADSDATRLRAAEQILKQYKLITDKQEVNHSGAFTIKFEEDLDD